ncbi:hypothetical protein Trco_000410 [Trichoderma cornu-damae]|uniref:DUF7729 domain-containing protein n=1 Tax=Trichoderma cornu-damae TaxID=654480 RepID=A0A9P8QRW5_9HYPO|nr:hypothetical protein Trco_000410 [Trichoderma cornu-damae]
MLNPLVFLSTSHSKTEMPRRPLCQMRLALLIVVFLATLGSAATVPDRASTRIPVLSVAAGQPPPSPSSEELMGLFSGHADEFELRLQLELESGGGSSSSSSKGHVPPLEKGEMRRRSAKAPTTTTTASSKPTSSPSSSSSPLPVPFDNTPASAFQSDGSTDACPNFISSLLSNPTFKSCYPLSMMLQTSTGFFQAEKSLLSIVRVLDATCRADSDSCAAFLDQAATNLTMGGNCKMELQKNQTLVLQAYRGLLAYKTLYAASCLQDPKSSQYCFANAVTNLDTPSDAYLYFLPYGLALPGSSNPSCSWCTQQTMDIYYSASSDRSHLVAGVYEDAARQVNTLCGPNYVNGTLPPATSEALAVRPAVYTISLAVLCAALATLVSI